MATSRREFLRLVGLAGAAGAAGATSARASTTSGATHDPWGMLTDLSLCIGCRKCEFACRESNGLNPPPIDTFEDQSILKERRRTDENNLTVVNRYESGTPGARPVYVKTQCMHCNQPACASACPVAALRKQPEGPVTYDASLCIGCRYCVLACPFSVPAYTYDNAFAPVVRKCSMCFETVTKKNIAPACARICPVEAITFGKRTQLLALAREKILKHPDKYVDHIYGETEVGGTSWLYLAPRSFADLGFRTDLGKTAYPELTAGFLSLVPTVVTIWPAILFGAYALTGRRHPSPAAAPESDATGHQTMTKPETKGA